MPAAMASGSWAGVGRVSRSPSSATTRRLPRGRSIGATPTSACTHTIGSALCPTSTHCLPRSTQIRRPSSGVDGRHHALDQRARRARGGPPALGRSWPDPYPGLGAVPTSAVHLSSTLARRELPVAAQGRRGGHRVTLFQKSGCSTSRGTPNSMERSQWQPCRAGINRGAVIEAARPPRRRRDEWAADVRARPTPPWSSPRRPRSRRGLFATGPAASAWGG
jgi:hypothetical protein